MLTVAFRIEASSARHVRALSLAAALVTVCGALLSAALWFGIMMSNGTGDELGTGPYYPPLLALDAIVVFGVMALMAAPWFEPRRQLVAVRLYWTAISAFVVVLPAFVVAVAIS